MRFTKWLPFLLLAPGLFAQDPGLSVFEETVDVRVVHLEAVVEDRSGQRVSGIASEEFRLTVDGEPVSIDYFTEVRERHTVSDASPPDTDVPGSSPGDRVDASYLVFIDEYFILAPHRDRVLAGLRARLSRLGPEDQVAIVAFDGKKIEQLSGWTHSTAYLAEVLETAQQRPAHGLVTSLFLRVGDRSDAGDEALIHELEQKTDRIALAVTSTLRSYASPPGRKIMLLVSGGWPYSAEHFVRRTEFRFEHRNNPSIDAIYETANLLGFTLYPVDAPGINSAGSLDAGSGESPGPNVREAETEQTLRLLARETGGRVILDSASLSALERVTQDTASYYSLGFTPDWRGDEQEHEIEIEIDRPGLRIRHRESFRDLSSQQQISFQVESALLFGQVAGSLPLGITIGEARDSSKKPVVPLTLAIPIDGIVFLPDRDQYSARLELRLAAIDDEGGRSEVDLLPFTLTAGGPPSPGQVVIQAVQVQMRARRQDLVVSVYDPISGTILASVVEVDL